MSLYAKRSSNAVTLTILLSIALTACNENELKHCVDSNNTVVDESKCTDAGTIASSSNGHSGFFWYYGGATSAASPGTKLTGGSTSPAIGRSYVTPGSMSNPSPGIVRGGFGGSGESAGS